MRLKVTRLGVCTILYSARARRALLESDCKSYMDTNTRIATGMKGRRAIDCPLWLLSGRQDRGFGDL